MTCPSGQSATVKLRIEGRLGTIYEQPINTMGRDVTTKHGGSHCCNCHKNGPPGNPPPGNPPPAGPTCTSALADAADAAGFTFDGDWYPSFNDFIITRIANSQAENWKLWVDHAESTVGGCQMGVNQGQEVLWALVPSSTKYALKLGGPETARVNQQYTATVTYLDGATPHPFQGATVRGVTTNANGEATFTFTSPGREKLKAEAPDCVRSNTINVVVSA